MNSKVSLNTPISASFENSALGSSSLSHALQSTSSVQPPPCIGGARGLGTQPPSVFFRGPNSGASEARAAKPTQPLSSSEASAQEPLGSSWAGTAKDLEPNRLTFQMTAATTEMNPVTSRAEGALQISCGPRRPAARASGRSRRVPTVWVPQNKIQIRAEGLHIGLQKPSLSQP